MTRKKTEIEPGTLPADSRYSIMIACKGPYFVFGQPSLRQMSIIPDEHKNAWEYRKGNEFPLDKNPTALCRCGHSAKKPYCDGAHNQVKWDSELTASNEPLLRDATIYSGVRYNLADNIDFCARARFCTAKGEVWNLIESDKTSETAAYEVSQCPSGRLRLRDKRSGDFEEPAFEPSLVLIEDPQRRCSAGLWVRGGIAMEDDGFAAYEIRNRVTLCRCGASKNKPFCDGAHIDIKFDDGLQEYPIDEF